MWRKQRFIITTSTMVTCAALTTFKEKSHKHHYNGLAYCDEDNNHKNKSTDDNIFSKKNSADCKDPVCASKMELFTKSMQYVKKSSQNTSKSNSTSITHPNNEIEKYSNDETMMDEEKFKQLNKFYENQKDCPLDKDEIGRLSWALLHTIAASLPVDSDLSEEDKLQLSNFMIAFAYLYPCHICSPDFQEFVRDNPPSVSNRTEFSLWICELHNHINVKLGKERVNCNINALDERWRYGKSSCWELHSEQ